MEAAAHTCDAPQITPLIAGQHTYVGHVKVCNDDTNLYVTYETTYPWCLKETHLHVAKEESYIPQTKKGNPIPGHFDYSDYSYEPNWPGATVCSAHFR